MKSDASKLDNNNNKKSNTSKIDASKQDNDNDIPPISIEYYDKNFSCHVFCKSQPTFTNLDDVTQTIVQYEKDNAYAILK
jgi:hypothetical protein